MVFKKNFKDRFVFKIGDRILWDIRLFSLLFLSFLGTVVIFECLFESVDNYRNQSRDKQIKPYYSISFYTRGGNRLGNQRGILRLMFHPQLVYTNFPNQKTPFFSINSKGFRGLEIGKKRDNIRRIVIVGGSTAFGTGLNSDSETFARQLENKLDHVEVINAAVAGYCSGQELTYLVTELVDLEPDLIIAFDGYNDYFQVWEFAVQGWVGIGRVDQVENELRKASLMPYSNFRFRWANAHKIFFPHTMEKLALIKHKVIDSVGQTARSNENLDLKKNGGRVDLDAVISAYLRNVGKMDRLAKIFQAHFICVIQPAKDSISGQDRNNKNSYFDFRTKVKKYFDDHQVKYIDLNEYSTRLADNMFMDDVHLDARGNKIMADIIGAVIIEEDLLET